MRVAVTDTSDNCISFDQPAIISYGNESVKFNSVTLISPLEASLDEQLHIARPQTTGLLAPLVAVKRLTVQKDREDIMQVESFLEAVSKVRHVGILGLLAYRIDRLDSAKSQVTLCSEYADRGTLHGTSANRFRSVQRLWAHALTR